MAVDKAKPLVLVGTGEMGEIAYEYFTHDSPYTVAGFAVEQKYRDRDTLFDLPVVAFEEVETTFPPGGHDLFVALSAIQLNRPRTRLVEAARAKGFRLASYVSSRAFVWRNVQIGENCFIFENNVLQYHVRVGDNTVLWSGNHVGHRTTIGANSFLSSHVVVSGFCTIGTGCYFGVNSCVADKVRIGDDCVVGMGAVVLRDAEGGLVYVGNPAKPMPNKTSFQAFGVGGVGG